MFVVVFLTDFIVQRRFDTFFPRDSFALQTAAVAAVWDSSHLPSAPSHRFVVTTSAPVDNDVTIASKDCSDRGDGQPVTSQKRMTILWTCLVVITLGVIFAFGVLLFRRIDRHRRDLPPGIILAT